MQHDPRGGRFGRKPPQWEITLALLRPVASATWRELIKRVWEVDPLICPQCA